MKKETLLLLLFVAICAGCSYEFSSDNFINLEKPINETQYIELVNFNNLDTINVQTTLVYRFNGLPNQNTLSSEVYIDDEPINKDWQGQSGTFIIRPQNYEDGTHTIRIEHKFSSGTGSIADQAGFETISEIATYQFVVNRLPSNPPAILSAAITDGTIFINWSTDYETDYINAYLSIKFKTSEIRIPLSNEELAIGTFNDMSTVLYQGDWNTSNFDEYSSVSYSILFENEYRVIYGDSQSISYQPDLVTTEIVFVDFNSYKFKWSAHPLYANFETFDFSFQNGEFSGSSQGGEYLVQSPYVFGQEYRFNGRPSNNQFTLPYFSYRNVSLNNDTFGEFELYPLFVKEIIFSPATNNYYALIIEDRSGFEYDFRIYEYSNDMELLRKSNLITYDERYSSPYKMTFDPSSNSIHLDGWGSAYKMDPVTLQILEEYKDPPFASQLLHRGDILARLEYASGQLTVMNVKTNTIIYSGVSTSHNMGYISPNGKYILLHTNTGNFVYRIDGNQLTQVFDFTSRNWNGILEIFGEKMFYPSNDDIVIFDLSTNTSSSFNFGGAQPSIQFDGSSQKLLVSQNGMNAVYNIITGEIIRFESEDNKYTTGLFNQQDRDYFMRLWNNRLIHSKGIYINMN